MTKSTVCLKWEAPAQDGGSKVQGYQVEILEKGKLSQDTLTTVGGCFIFLTTT